MWRNDYIIEICETNPNRNIFKSFWNCCNTWSKSTICIVEKHDLSYWSIMRSFNKWYSNNIIWTYYKLYYTTRRRLYQMKQDSVTSLFYKFAKLIMWLTYLNKQCWCLYLKNQYIRLECVNSKILVINIKVVLFFFFLVVPHDFHGEVLLR